MPRGVKSVVEPAAEPVETADFEVVETVAEEPVVEAEAEAAVVEAVTDAPDTLPAHIVAALDVRWGELVNFVRPLTGDTDGPLGEVLAFVRSKL